MFFFVSPIKKPRPYFDLKQTLNFIFFITFLKSFQRREKFVDKRGEERKGLVSDISAKKKLILVSMRSF
jgi:hypothetical protein